MYFEIYILILNYILQFEIYVLILNYILEYIT